MRAVVEVKRGSVKTWKVDYIQERVKHRNKSTRRAIDSDNADAGRKSS